MAAPQSPVEGAGTGSDHGIPEVGSFRDPSGFVYRAGGQVLRQVNKSFGSRWDELNESGLLATLQRGRLLVGHELADPGVAYAPPLAHAVIRPEPVPFISYPYEWSFSQLRDAALMTLEAQVAAAAMGFTLRDASAYNVQFLNGAPILMDTLSFERAQPDSPWLAYRQFCEHFLAPLALMAHRDVRCGLMLREFIDGVPVDLAAALLPSRTKLDLGLASHIHAHSRVARHRGNRQGPGDRPPRMSAFKRSALIDNLRRTVAGLSWRPIGTAWADYADHTSYNEAAARSKDEIVRRLLEVAGGNVVWDLGANVGRFSAIAAALGRRVIAWDSDPAATELHYQAVRRTSQRSVLPLLVDLANPSPGLGWANMERRPMVERADADVVLALALVHHLSIGRNIRVSMIAEFFASLGRHLIVEFIPESDPMVQRLVGARDDVLPSLTIEGFRDVFSTRFDVIDDMPISSSERRLLLMSRL